MHDHQHLKTAGDPSTWIPSFSQLIQLYFVIITATAFLAATLPFLRDSILSYGKLDYPSSTTNTATATNASPAQKKPLAVTPVADRGRFFAVLKTLKVPKTWFAHFYVFATLWMVYLSLDLLVYSLSSTSPVLQIVPSIFISTYSSWSFLTLLNLIGIMPSHPHSLSWTPPPALLLAMSCYLIQVVRRWYESWFVERPSPQATLHIGHYLIGITFYTAMAPAIWVDTYESWVKSTVLQNQTDQHQSQLPLQTWIGFALFLWGSLHQYRCHVILANLRKPSSRGASAGVQRQQEYKVPFGDWFQYLVTPHYSAEMVIYLGLYLMVSSSLSLPISPTVPTMLYSLVWVIVNLGIVARETDQWYRTRFGNNYTEPKETVAGQQRQPKTARRAILIPFVY
ncbi:hypothetical protein BGX21_007274 [Mortierella sp. AD011]|nr:hypothetical protein BGX20_008272 [Mortierella sp. AD010]KAF9398795.1 hypothetical protein BGX21_007274 [Mortierella sp. AD011]